MTPNPQAQALIELLQLERIETNIWRGGNEERFGFRLFGGQVLAQALAAANRTVDAERPCHSLHGYFLRPGTADVPVIYKVEQIRDGQSFTTRRIVAVQNGEAIFSMDASFHRRELGLTHQIEMRDIPPPESLEDDSEVARRLNDPNQQWAMRERAFERRSIFQQTRPADDQISNPMWIRYRQPVDQDPILHRCLLAYASDMNLVSTAILPHRNVVKPGKTQIASLDHAVWFHHDPDINDWLIYMKETPQGGAGRGFTRGAFYTRDGELIASTMQEGLIRIRQETLIK
ncbi:MAG: acyl-CoA thioesterase-2 [Candidatus Azotimanducaceae bacterium]|jgi:acyl-CoA thioesterase-2